MLRVRMIPLALLALSGCGSSAPEVAEQIPSAGTRATYSCSAGKSFEAAFAPEGADDAVAVRFQGREALLVRETTYAGLQYSDGDVTFWMKGDSALLQAGGGLVFTGCTRGPGLIEGVPTFPIDTQPVGPASPPPTN